jgi:S1-C subfamily serine protease
VNLRAGGAAEQAKPALQREDVVVDVEGTRVRTVADLEGVTKSLLVKQARVSALVMFERGDERRLAIVELLRPRTEDPVLEALKASLPISVQALTPALADRLGLKGRTGVRVTRVADSAVPLKVGDLILAIDGAIVRASAPADEDVFATLLRQYAIGTAVTLTVHRDGAEVPVTATLRAAPRQAREMRRYEDPDFGFRVRELAESDLNDPRLRGTTRGLVVDAIEQGGWAALARLAVGDVILAADGRAIDGLDGFAARLKAAVARRAAVVFKIRRGVRTRFVDLQAGWQ